jgi:hypothetical protein
MPSPFHILRIDKIGIANERQVGDSHIRLVGTPESGISRDRTRRLSIVLRTYRRTDLSS